MAFTVSFFMKQGRRVLFLHPCQPKEVAPKESLLPCYSGHSAYKTLKMV